MSAEIVPVQLGLTKGDLYTLWAPSWRDADDEWQAFLGKDEDVYAFESVADLVAFIRADDDNDLVDHPGWKALTEASAHLCDPADDQQHDLVGVPDLVAEKPTEESVQSLLGDPQHRAGHRIGVRPHRGREALQRQPGAGDGGRWHRRVRRPRRPQALDRDRGGHRPQLGRRARRHRLARHHSRRRRGHRREGGRGTGRAGTRAGGRRRGRRRRDRRRRDRRRRGHRSRGRCARSRRTGAGPRQPRGLLGPGRHRPGPDHDERRDVLHAAVLPRRSADLPWPQRPDQRVRLRACPGALPGRRARERPVGSGHLSTTSARRPPTARCGSRSPTTTSTSLPSCPTTSPTVPTPWTASSSSWPSNCSGTSATTPTTPPSTRRSMPISRSGRFVAYVLDPGSVGKPTRALRQGRRAVRAADHLRGVAAAHRVAR